MTIKEDEKKKCKDCKKEMESVEIGEKGKEGYRKIQICWDCHMVFYNKKTVQTIIIGGLSKINLESGTFEITLPQQANIFHLPQWDKKMLKITIEEI